MLRRIVAHFPLKNLSAKTTYQYSIQNHNKDKRNRKKNSITRFELQKLLLTHIRYLRKKVDQKKEPRSSLQGDFMKRMGGLIKPLNSPSQKAQETEEDWQQKLKSSFYFSIRLFAFLLITSWLLGGSNDEQQQQFSRQKVRRIVNQNQMINLLAHGSYNPELIIVRQLIASQNGKRNIYQTLCLAKEANKSDTPITCIVVNLPNFLKRVESINFPYNVTFHYSAVPPSNSNPLKIDLGKIIVYGVIAFFLWRIRSRFSSMGGGGGMSQMLNMKKFQPIKPQNINTLFKDVAGMHQAKNQVTQFVDFLKNPEKYINMGAKVPKGALLTGPPGTGKTLLARACAGEAGVPFFYVSGSQFVQKYVGLGANRVRSLFEAAGKSAPSIIFIDQIDAIGKKRNSGPFSNEEKQNTLNQLLVNMDGFDSKNKIIVMAATNLKDSLDPALLRPGRFDRSIEITVPNFEERAQILKVHLEKVKFTQKFSIQELAKKISLLTTGFSGAELANICNEAAILAAREDKQAIELPQFQKATERVMAGLEKRNMFSDEQKECLAYYECGKTVVSWFTKGADPIIKISIAPFSKQKSGYSHDIKDEMPLKLQEQLQNKAICYLAGRISQRKFKGYTTSNGDADLKKVKRILTFMVAKLGMSPVIGKIGYPDTQYMRKPYSKMTQSKIDKEIKRLFDQCQHKAEELVNEKADLIQKLKQLIIEKETLTHTALKEVLGDRPFEDNENYQKFLKDSQEVEQPSQQATMTPPAP